MALNQNARKCVKVVVVGNPCNTNCLIAANNAPDIPIENFTAMTRLDHDRGLAQLAKRAQCGVSDIEGFRIWGNHSSTMYPDVSNAKINGKPVLEARCDYPSSWSQQRGLCRKRCTHACQRLGTWN